MPTPTLVTITGDVAPDVRATGIYFRVPSNVAPSYNAGPDVILPGTPYYSPIASDGTFSLQVPGTNDPAWSPSNWTYKVQVVGDNLLWEFDAQVPYDAGSMNFSSLLPAQPASSGTLYAAFNHTHEGGGGGSGALPSGTVSSGTAFGTSSTAGAAATYSRGDHNHGTPAAPTPASIGAATSGHNHSGTYDPAGTATAAVATHAGLPDPHPNYLTTAEGNAAYDASGSSAAAVSAHEGAANPHPTYLTQAEGDGLYQPAGSYAAAVHTHTAANVTDFTEAVQDVVGGMVVAGANVTATYNDGANTLTIAASGGGGGASTTVKRAIVTSGDITPQNTSSAWQPLTGGPTLVIAAAAGDYISVEVMGMLTDPASTTFIELAVLNGASLARFGSTGTGTPGVEGDPAFYPDTVNFTPIGPPILDFVAEAGDINGGNVTVCFAVNSAGSGKIYAGAAFPLRWRLINHGAITVT